MQNRRMACSRNGWYFSKKEMEKNSPSIRDGINLKKETFFRKSYCTFLKELGMKIRVPQVAIATATVFCHRFFVRLSHAKHDRFKIATACLFLASKVEENPRKLESVILYSYAIIHKKDSETAQRMLKEERVYGEQMEQILQAEKLVLETLDFDISVKHPYSTLVEATKKFEGIGKLTALRQVAWNFVNDGLRTTLCLQFKPQQIAGGAVFLAAKFLKIKLPSDGQKCWWHEFDVTPRQLEEISNQILDLYDQHQNSPARTSKAKATKVLADGGKGSS